MGQLILIILAAIILLIVILGLIIPKSYSLSASVVINRPKQEVFNYVKLLRNQEYYSKWVMADPNVKMNYQGTDGTIGFKAAWDSEVKNVGKGEQEITDIKEGERYDVVIRFEKPFKGTSYAHTTTEAAGPNQTKVTNTFNTTTPFPMNIMTPMLKGMLVKDMNENMQNLKRNLEG